MAYEMEIFSNVDPHFICTVNLFVVVFPDELNYMLQYRVMDHIHINDMVYSTLSSS